MCVCVCVCVSFELWALCHSILAGFNVHSSGIIRKNLILECPKPRGSFDLRPWDLRV